MNNKDIFSLIAAKLDYDTLRSFYLVNKNTYKAVNTLWKTLSFRYTQLQKEEETNRKKEEGQKHKSYFIQMANLEKLGKHTKNFPDYLYCLAEYSTKTSLNIVSLKEFGYLNLTKLVVNNTMMKEIPDSIARLQKLQELNLINNEIVDISKVSSIRTLEILILSGNKIESIPPDLQKLQKLKELDISWNRITQIENIWNIKSGTVRLYHNHIDIIPLENIIKIRNQYFPNLFFDTKNGSTIICSTEYNKKMEIKDNVLYLVDDSSNASIFAKPYTTFKVIFSDFIKLFLIVCIISRSFF